MQSAKLTIGPMPEASRFDDGPVAFSDEEILDDTPPLEWILYYDII